MDEVSKLERALLIMLAEGEGCHCLHRNTCAHIDSEWCRHITGKGSHVRISQYKELDITPCLYRERPGCCWVLAAIEKLAADYLRKGAVHCPPVPSEAVTLFDGSHRIELRLVPLKVHHGAIWFLGREWVIQLNARESPQERRHTVFHEGFHIVCRNTSPAFRRLDLEQRHPFREFVADHFATCILMPKEWFKEQWPKVRDVREMAYLFDVSEKAMVQRLRQLDLL